MYALKFERNTHKNEILTNFCLHNELTSATEFQTFFFTIIK